MRTHFEAPLMYHRFASLLTDNSLLTESIHNDSLSASKDEISTDPKPIRKSALPFDTESQNPTNSIVCPLIGSVESEDYQTIKYCFVFKSKLSQAYWDSHGLLAYITN